MKMIAWKIRDGEGWTVDTIFYAEGCDEQYIRSAEDIPPHYSLKVES